MTDSWFLDPLLQIEEENFKVAFATGIFSVRLLSLCYLFFSYINRKEFIKIVVV